MNPETKAAIEWLRSISEYVDPELVQRVRIVCAAAERESDSGNDCWGQHDCPSCGKQSSDTKRLINSIAAAPEMFDLLYEATGSDVQFDGAPKCGWDDWNSRARALIRKIERNE